MWVFITFAVMFSDDFFSMVAACGAMRGSDVLLHGCSGANFNDSEVDLRAVAVQLDARRACASKLPSFLSQKRFLFADSLCAEQATHEDVAAFHASLLPAGARVLDMTAGLGIDAMTMAGSGMEVTAVELNERRAAVLKHNAAEMQATMEVVCADSVEWLRQTSREWDAIFIDPARRDNAGRRTYALADCTPDVSAILPLLLDHAGQVIVKASPMLDVSSTLHDLPGATLAAAVSVKGECKELLVRVERAPGELRLEAIDIDSTGRVERFSLSDSDMRLPVHYIGEVPQPGMYLYEPSPSLMKIAPWGAMQAKYQMLEKADANTHIFFSHSPVAGVPGRMLRIDALPDRKALKRLRGEHLNVVVRNYPQGAEALAVRLGIKGGHSTRFLYGLRVAGRPLLLLASQ